MEGCIVPYYYAWRSYSDLGCVLYYLSTRIGEGERGRKSKRKRERGREREEEEEERWRKRISRGRIQQPYCCSL